MNTYFNKNRVMNKQKFESKERYNIIYADPPWSYKDKAKAGNRGAECKYPVMSIEQLKELPIQDITSDNCVLFLWVTFPMLPEAFPLIQSWGFTYKTVAFNWVKRNKIADSWFWGMGNWTRSNSEICLLATKGKPKKVSSGVHSVLDNKISKHSRKPNETRKRIIELCGDIPRIELFARERLEGFDTWGNELENDINLIKNE